MQLQLKRNARKKCSDAVVDKHSPARTTLWRTIKKHNGLGQIREKMQPVRSHRSTLLGANSTPQSQRIEGQQQHILGQETIPQSESSMANPQTQKQCHIITQSLAVEQVV